MCDEQLKSIGGEIALSRNIFSFFLFAFPFIYFFKWWRTAAPKEAEASSTTWRGVGGKHHYQLWVVLPFPLSLWVVLLGLLLLWVVVLCSSSVG